MMRHCKKRPASCCASVYFFRSEEALKMPLNPSDVERLAHLARIGLTAAELQSLTEEISDILNLFEHMAAVDTSGIAPMIRPLDMVQRLRPDEVTMPDERELLQSLAPLTEEGLYLVPRVID